MNASYGPCDWCVETFASMGGCRVMMADMDPSEYIPEGCDMCAEEAGAYCMSMQAIVLLIYLISMVSFVNMAW